MPEIDGYLYHAFIDADECVHGIVFNDRKGRFADGEMIRTSTVRAVLQNADSRYFNFPADIFTLNSRYRVINWANGSKTDGKET